MTTKKLNLLAILSLSSICSVAIAEPLYTGTVTTADHGLYMSLEGGYAWLMGTPNSPMNGGPGSSQVGAFAWGANIGYAWPLDAISALTLEVGYANNGQSKYTDNNGSNDDGTVKINSVDYQILGGFNSTWASGVNGFFKLGAAIVKQNAQSNGNVTINNTVVAPFNTTAYHPEPMIVFGVGYKFTPSINTYIEFSGILGNWNSSWNQVNPSPSGINTPSAVLAVKAGLNYAFSE